MSYPPVFNTVKAWPQAVALLGTSPMQVWPFGQVPASKSPNYKVPYVAWQVVGGAPENYLGDRPDVDQFTVQLDVYGTTADSVRQVAEAVRDAIELKCHIVSWRGESRDTETQLYRSSFDADWFVGR